MHTSSYSYKKIHTECGVDYARQITHRTNCQSSICTLWINTHSFINIHTLYAYMRTFIGIHRDVQGWTQIHDSRLLHQYIPCFCMLTISDCITYSNRKKNTITKNIANPRKNEERKRLSSVYWIAKLYDVCKLRVHTDQQLVSGDEENWKNKEWPPCTPESANIFQKTTRGRFIWARIWADRPRVNIHLSVNSHT